MVLAEICLQRKTVLNALKMTQTFQQGSSRMIQECVGARVKRRQRGRQPLWGTEEAFLGHVVGTSPHSNVTSDLTVRVSHWDQSAVTAIDSGLGKVRSLTSVLQA